MGGDGFHAPPSPGDLDHDLRRSADDGFDAVANHRGATRAPVKTGRIRLDDAVAGIEQAIAPLDELGFGRTIFAHGRLPARLDC